MTEEQEKEADMKILKDVCKVLREQFDTVQIFVTRGGDDDGTRAADWGTGNWYARYGQVGSWVKRQDAYDAKLDDEDD